MDSTPAGSFRGSAIGFRKLVQTAKKNRISLTSHSYYGPRARAGVAALRKNFVLLQRRYPAEKFPAVAYQLATISPMVDSLVKSFPDNKQQLIELLDAIVMKVDSDLSAELETSVEAQAAVNTSAATFLPEDLIDARHKVMVRILWEINRTYERECYNSCAAMIRRIIENLIIEAFETKGIGTQIRKNGSYLEFSALIGKAANEPALKLTRVTKKALPDIKVFGDVGVHNRMALVRKGDLDRLHSAIRLGIEELSRVI